MYRLYIIFLFPLTGVAENRFSNIWVICSTTSEIKEEIGNQFSVDHPYSNFMSGKKIENFSNFPSTVSGPLNKILKNVFFMHILVWIWWWTINCKILIVLGLGGG